jgi:pimeloyl-ACP methyl ester carboxylesterase
MVRKPDPKAGRLFRLAAAITWLGAPAVPAADTAWQKPIDVEFVARADGSRQRYVLMLPGGFDPAQPADLLIALHGHGSDRWQFVRDGRDECRAVRDAAARFGLVFVSPDYRARTSWMGPKAEADVLEILDELRQKYRVRSVLICGGSMGASSALSFAALHPDRVDGVVALNGTANHLEYRGFQEAIAASFGGTKAEVFEVYRSRSAELSADRLAMPIAATVGGRDQVVPPDSVRRLLAKLRGQGRPVCLIDRPDGGHATNYADTLAAVEFVWRQCRSRQSVSTGRPLP